MAKGRTKLFVVAVYRTDALYIRPGSMNILTNYFPSTSYRDQPNPRWRPSGTFDPVIVNTIREGSSVSLNRLTWRAFQRCQIRPQQESKDTHENSQVTESIPAFIQRLRQMYDEMIAFIARESKLYFLEKRQGPSPFWKESDEQRKNEEERQATYLNDPQQMERFKQNLLRALSDPAYYHTRSFDWPRFLNEFSKTDFDPPLNMYHFTHHVWPPHFGPAWSRMRHKLWWLIKLKANMENPTIWANEQMQTGRLAQVVGLLGEGVTEAQLRAYLNRQPPGSLAKPRVPDEFNVLSKTLLTLVERDDIMEMWGFECRRRGKTFTWAVRAYDETAKLPHLLEQANQPLRVLVERFCEQNRFQPEVILFYSSRAFLKETGQIVRKPYVYSDYPELLDHGYYGKITVIARWDEDGWPVAQCGRIKIGEYVNNPRR